MPVFDVIDGCGFEVHLQIKRSHNDIETDRYCQLQCSALRARWHRAMSLTPISFVFSIWIQSPKMYCKYLWFLSIRYIFRFIIQNNFSGCEFFFSINVFLESFYSCFTSNKNIFLIRPLWLFHLIKMIICIIWILSRRNGMCFEVTCSAQMCEEYLRIELTNFPVARPGTKLDEFFVARRLGIIGISASPACFCRHLVLLDLSFYFVICNNLLLLCLFLCFVVLFPLWNDYVHKYVLYHLPKCIKIQVFSSI